MWDDNLDTPATSLWATSDYLKDGPDLALGKWLLRARTHLRHLVPGGIAERAARSRCDARGAVASPLRSRGPVRNSSSKCVFFG